MSTSGNAMNKRGNNYTSKPLSESVHACLRADLPSGKGEGHLCQKMGCEIVFSPKRKTQRFCSEECRHAYYALAREVGIAILEKIPQDNVRSGDEQPPALLVSLKFPKLSIDLLDPGEAKKLDGFKPEEKLSGKIP